MAKLPTYEEMGKKVAEEALDVIYGGKTIREWIEILVKQKPWEDCISRQAVMDAADKVIERDTSGNNDVVNAMIAWSAYIKSLPPVTPQPKTGHCKDCKWWKDSDGAYRRGIGAESQCPMNRKEVYEGNGYCFLFKPRESEE